MNLFFLLTFPLTALTASFTFRAFGLHSIPSIVGAILFAFLPYHFARGELHLFLAAYYIVPLTLLVSLWLNQGMLSGQSDKPWRARFALAMVCSLLTSSGGVYYAFFGSFFILIGAVGGTISTGRSRTLLVGLVLVGMICVGVLLNISRSIAFNYREGSNPAVARRVSGEADLYGLHMANLFLPRDGHRLKPLADIKQIFIESPQRLPPSEGDKSLGFVGTIGLVTILFAGIFRPPAAGKFSLLTILGISTICGLLLGSIGGGGSLFAFFISPQIRCYNRISVLLGFFALFGVVVLLDRLIVWARTSWQWRGSVAICGLVLIFGIWDQTSLSDIPQYAINLRAHHSMEEFAQTVESVQPEGGLVFQLPYVRFPEEPDRYKMGCYDHFRLFLHTRKLRFSHGAVRGRYGAEVFASLTKLPPQELVERLVQMGYTGLHVDRYGYRDNAVCLEAQLRDLLKVEPVVSNDGRDLFFSLEKRLELMRGSFTAQDWEQKVLRARSPLLAVWTKPFDAELSTSTNYWHWCHRQAGTIRIANPDSVSRSATIRFQVATDLAGASHLCFSGLIQDRLEVHPTIDIERKIVVPPGGASLRLEIEGKRHFLRWRYYFRVCDLEIHEDP